jgi:hypothetical protein
MVVAPEPYLAAFQWVLHRAIISCRFGHWQWEFSSEHTAELMDAIHNIPTMIQNWVPEQTVEGIVSSRRRNLDLLQSTRRMGRQMGWQGSFSFETARSQDVACSRPGNWRNPAGFLFTPTVR